MPINTRPCDTCEHYDPVMRGITGKGGLKETTWGWCAKKSKYPYQEGPGQKFPVGAARVEQGEPAQPFIIRKGAVQVNCMLYMPKTAKVSKADLLKQLSEKTGGGKIIGH